MTVELPVPPAANRYWRVYRNRVVTSDEARTYKAAVGIRCLLARLKPLAGEVSVTVTWRRGRMAGDLDGRLKVLLDALEGHAYRNDNQVVEIHAYRVEDKAHPGVTVTVEPVDKREHVR